MERNVARYEKLPSGILCPPDLSVFRLFAAHPSPSREASSSRLLVRGRVLRTPPPQYDSACAHFIHVAHEQRSGESIFSPLFVSVTSCRTRCVYARSMTDQRSANARSDRSRVVVPSFDATRSKSRELSACTIHARRILRMLRKRRYIVKGMLQLGLQICVLRPLRRLRNVFRELCIFGSRGDFQSKILSVDRVSSENRRDCCDKEAAPFLGNSSGTGLEGRNFLCFLNDKNKSMKYIWRKVWLMEVV